MAYFKHTFECPDCGHSWTQRLASGDAWPRFCTGCGTDLSAPQESFTPMAPSVITGVAGRSGDQVFRMMEASSEHRIDQAAAHLGVDKAELSDMKVTNIRDNARVGENSAIAPPPNPVSHAMETHKSITGYQGSSGAVYGLGRPDAGAATAGGIQRFHQQNIAAERVKGQLNK